MPGARLESPEAGAVGFDRVHTDTRSLRAGDLFVALRGERFDAHDFLPQAQAAGAAAALVERADAAAGLPCIVVPDALAALQQLASAWRQRWHGPLVAVTGSNGKTSTVEMTRQIWRMCGERAASIGTLGVTTPDGSVATGLTTPDIVTFLGNMAGLAREGVTYVAYEASSHGLAQYRSEGLPVAASAFTNFSRDHLDYHGTMEDYFAAKLRLFSEVVTAGSPAIIHIGAEDTVWMEQAVAFANARGLDVRTVGEGGSFLKLIARAPTQLGQTLTIAFAGAERKVNLPLIGAYQAANALVAAGLALSTGMAPAAVFDALTRLQPVRGRLERAAINMAGAPAYVDYAHTPDALEAAMAALRPHVGQGGRLIVVFGAGGDRDAGKRALMGAAAAHGADQVIVTDDNPRTEDPAAIRAAIMAGAGAKAREIGDRRAAIAAAIGDAGAQDIVLIAGKGHEQGQIFGSGDTMRIEAFDDVEVARQCAGAGSVG